MLSGNGMIALIVGVIIGWQAYRWWLLNSTNVRAVAARLEIFKQHELLWRKLDRLYKSGPLTLEDVHSDQVR